MSCRNTAGLTGGWMSIGRLSITVVALNLLIPMNPAFSQSGFRAREASITREQSRDYLDDLNKSLSDTNREFYSSRRATPRRTSVEPLSRPTQEMERLRPMLNDALNGIQNLGYTLRQELETTPAVRGLLAEVVKVRAQLTRVVEIAQQENDHLVLIEEFRDLDARWRELAYGLSGVRNLSREARREVQNLDQIAQSITDLLKVAPQVDRDALYERSVSLRSELNRLADEISLELDEPPEVVRELRTACNRAEQKVRAVIQLVRDDEDSRVVADTFKQFQTIWYPQAVRLQQMRDRNIDLTLRKVTQAESDIHKLLMLPTQTDKEQLLYLAANLKRDIDNFFERTPLKLLVHLPRSNTVLSTADEFWGVCDNFVDVVNRGANAEQIQDAFQYIEQAEKSFLATFRAIDSDEALQVLRQLDATVNTLRTSLNVQRDDFNRRGATELSRELDALTEQLNQATRRWLSHDRVAFASQAIREADSFSESARILADEIASGVPVAKLSQRVEDTYETWRRLYNYLIKCQTEDRPTLGRISSRVTPALVELRTMLAQ